jgi:hypothetical protein
MCCVRRQLRGDVIAIHDEAIQHQGQIGVSDAPIAE